MLARLKSDRSAFHSDSAGALMARWDPEFDGNSETLPDLFQGLIRVRRDRLLAEALTATEPSFRLFTLLPCQDGMSEYPILRCAGLEGLILFGQVRAVRQVVHRVVAWLLLSH